MAGIPVDTYKIPTDTSPHMTNHKGSRTKFVHWALEVACGPITHLKLVKGARATDAAARCRRKPFEERHNRQPRSAFACRAISLHRQCTTSVSACRLRSIRLAGSN